MPTASISFSDADWDWITKTAKDNGKRSEFIRVVFFKVKDNPELRTEIEELFKKIGR